MREPTRLERLDYLYHEVRQAVLTYTRSRDPAEQARALDWLVLVVPDLAETIADLQGEPDTPAEEAG